MPDRFTPTPETRAGHRRMLRALTATFVCFGLLALGMTALLTWWR